MNQYSITLLAAIALFGSLSFGLSGKNPPRNDGSGNTQCAWYDSGKTEEHGNHLTENSCLASHGRCSRRCFVYESVCTVEGLRVEISYLPDGKVERKDVLTSFTGRHRDQYRAREIADRSCLTAYPRQDGCRQRSCSEEATRVD